jgi:hypothetical protein
MVARHGGRLVHKEVWSLGSSSRGEAGYEEISNDNFA